MLIDFLPAGTVTSMATCVGPPDAIVKGSTGVFINYLPAARIGDLTTHGGVIITGSPTVMIGEIGAGSPGNVGMAGIVGGVATSLGATRAVASVYSASAKPAPPSTECAAKAAADKKLAADTSDRVQKILGRRPAPGPAAQPGDFGPEFRPGDWSSCQNKAADMGPVMRRFERYSTALPASRAALNTNQLGDEAGDKAKAMDCVTRLPDDAQGLNKALNLPPGTLTDADLRNDKTGFRAAIYRSDSDGKLILVARDTEAQSLVDWKTNTDNGQGLETDQYSAMRKLSGRLTATGTDFNMAGYSKDGGLAQEAGLINTEGSVSVFNSAGVPAESSGRSAGASLQGLVSRTSSFSSEGDFLTYLNQTTDPSQQIQNAEWLKAQLAKSPLPWNPIGLKYLNPLSIPCEHGSGCECSRSQRSSAYR